MPTSPPAYNQHSQAETMRSLRYRPAALADLAAIYDFIEPDSPKRARHFVEDIRTRCRVLRDHPQLGVARPDLGPDIRILPLRNRSIVAYRIAEDAIYLVRVFYGGQDYETILKQENP